jgi:hypothetical protein
LKMETVCFSKTYMQVYSFGEACDEPNITYTKASNNRPAPSCRKACVYHSQRIHHFYAKWRNQLQRVQSCLERWYPNSSATVMKFRNFYGTELYVTVFTTPQRQPLTLGPDKTGPQPRKPHFMKILLKF